MKVLTAILSGFMAVFGLADNETLRDCRCAVAGDND